MNLTNYHSHCSFCDGRAAMEDFVKSAVEAGFSSYGISSHAPLPFRTHWSLDAGRVSEYFNEVNRLKVTYGEIIRLYAGLEIDYLNEKHNPSVAYFQRMPLDYRIGSVHMIYTDEGEIVDTDTNPENFKHLLDVHFHGDLQGMVSRYFDASMRMVEAGGFDFIGHADKISFNAGCCLEGATDTEWYAKRRTELFALIAEKGLMMEINTKAFLKKGCFFPGAEHFRFIKKLGIPVVVNSDAHFPELIQAGRPEALRCLKEAGFRSVRQLQDGQWRDVGID